MQTVDDADARTPQSDAGLANRPTHAADSDTTAIASIVKSACQTVHLTEERQRELRQCLVVILNPDSSRLERGDALLDIIEKQLMPTCGDLVQDSYTYFKLDQLEARELVKLARAERAKNGRTPAFTTSSVRPTAPGSNKESPASASPALKLEAGGPEPAQGAAPEQKQTPLVVETKPVAVAAPPVDDQAQDLDQSQVKPTTPSPVSSELAPAEAFKPSAGAGTTLLPETNLAATAVVTKSGLQPISPADPSVDDWASRINHAFDEALNRFIFVGRELHAAKRALGHGHWMAMFKSGRIKMGLRLAEMFMHIAAHQTLSNPQHLAILPHSLTTLDVLAGGSVEVIEAGIKDGKINPDLTANEARKLVRAHCPRPVVKSPANNCKAGTISPPSETEAADLPTSPAESQVAGVADASDNPLPNLTPMKVATTQPEAPPVNDPALCGSEKLDLEAEWLVVEAALDSLHRRCSPKQLREYWDKLNAFVCRHPDLVPAEERMRAG